MSTLILAASVLALGFGVAYTLFKPRWALMFILVLYPLEQLLTTAAGFFVANQKFINILVGLLALFGAGTAFLGGHKPFRGYFNPVWMCTILLYAWATLGILFAPEPDEGIINLTIGFPYLGLLLVLAPLLVNGLDDFRRLMVPTMVVGAFIITMILLSPKTAMFGGRLGIEGSGPDGPEILNPLATASLAGTIVIFGMLYKPERNVAIVNVIRAVAITVGLIMALLSGSRGQLIGAVFCGIAFFPFARQIKNIVQFFTVSVTAGVGLIFVMLVLNMATTQDAASRWSGDSLTEGVGTRGNLVTTILGEYISNPAAVVQGLGTSSFKYYWTMDDTPYVHNLPVQILTENGLIGFGLMIVIMLLTARAGYQLLRMYREYPTELSTAAILSAFCVYQFLLSLKQGDYFPSAAPFWTFLLLAKVHARSLVDAREYAEWASYHEQSGYGQPANPG